LDLGWANEAHFADGAVDFVGKLQLSKAILCDRGRR